MTLLKRNNVNVIGSIITMIKDKDVQYSSEYYSQNQYNKIRKDIDRNS
jgi:hypothetical protein